MKCKNSQEPLPKPNWSILQKCKDFMEQDFKHNLPTIKLYINYEKVRHNG